MHKYSSVVSKKNPSLKKSAKTQMTPVTSPQLDGKLGNSLAGGPDSQQALWTNANESLKESS
jgi:hypothetical protein